MNLIGGGRGADVFSRLFHADVVEIFVAKYEQQMKLFQSSQRIITIVSRTEVRTLMLLKIQVFWDVTPF
jgi:hypothetical protein